MRFATSAGASAVQNPATILAQMEEDKRKREERAAKFGTSVANTDADKQKREERMARFKTEADAQNDEQKAKIAERKARFAVNSGAAGAP